MEEGARPRDERPGGGRRSASLLRRIWRSAFPRRLVARTDRERAQLTRFTFLLHLRPVRLPEPTLRWTHTFGLGGSSLVLVVVQAVTGILMMLVYRPVPEAAYGSVLELEREVLFGSLVRGTHWWAANMLVVVVVLHMARVFLTGGYHGPRQFNWVIGCVLLSAVATAAFTGYLLPWDQLAYWAVTVATGMLAYVPGVGESLQHAVRGGTDVGADTLTTFYTLHTTIVPVVLIVLMGFHFWRVRRAGGVVVPPPAERDDETGDTGRQVLFLPHLLGREVAQALVVVALVVVLGAAFGAPLGAPANTGMSPNPTKAPWYFVGFQELLIHLHPMFALLVVPAIVGLGFVLLPYLADDDGPAGQWFLTDTGRTTATVAAVLAAVATGLAVGVDAVTPGRTGWVTGGLLPFGVTAMFVGGLAWFVRRRWQTGRNETIQTVVVALSVCFAVLTLVGVWFRGPGMQLMWPWLR
jgi:quinol-cytochrome oxidoreductase complex cytochrome b subunit